jgi:indole-3-glycerol phosphate synthase
MSILAEIFAHKRDEVADRSQTTPLSQVRRAAEQTPPALDFAAALRSRRANSGRPALIAEVKRASPSRGLLLPDFDPVHLARVYQQNGAAAISVLTDERYFQGHLDFLAAIAALQPRLPLLRKDFICDPYQVYEARAAGADAVLLIAAHLDQGCLRELHTLICELGMTPLVEVHSREELETTLEYQPRLVGINNRDLRDFTVRLETTLALRPFVPDEVCLVSESGIHTGEDVTLLAQAGVDAILVGEALVVAKDIAAKVRSLSA